MKYFSRLFLMLALICCSTSSWAVVLPTDAHAVVNSSSLEMDAEAFLALNSKSLAKQLGRKAKFKEKVVLKIAQIQIKRQLKKGNSVDLGEEYAAANRNFNIGGFLLGLFFSLIGVLIAILFGRNAVRSALLGALVGLILGLLGWLIF